MFHRSNYPKASAKCFPQEKLHLIRLISFFYQTSNTGRETIDGDFAILSDFSAGNSKETYLLKVDTDGYEMGRKTFEDRRGLSLEITEDEGFIILSLPDLYRTDSDGNEIWSEGIGGYLSSVGRTDFCPISEYNYIILGGRFLRSIVLSKRPIAEAGSDQMIVFDKLTLDGSQSYDPDGYIASFLWEADTNMDGSYSVAIGNGPIIILTLEDIESLGLNGKITGIRLTVTDNDGLTDSDILLLASAGPCPISPFPDEDEDGEPDLSDLCPDTPRNTDVDSDGCSLLQFCTSIDTSMDHGRKICDRSDWKNDEPLVNKGDCQAIKEGQGHSNYRCVPR